MYLTDVYKKCLADYEQMLNNNEVKERESSSWSEYNQ